MGASQRRLSSETRNSRPRTAPNSVAKTSPENDKLSVPRGTESLCSNSIWRAGLGIIRTHAISIKVIIREELTETSRIAIKIGKGPDVVAFQEWLSNSMESEVVRLFKCGRITAWRAQRGQLSRERLTAMASLWEESETQSVLHFDQHPSSLTLDNYSYF